MNAHQDDSIIVAAVAEKLKKYLDIQRREQSFDLSQPILRRPKQTIKLHRKNNYLESTDDITEISKASAIKHEIKKMQSIKRLSGHEQQTRLTMERQMARYTNPHVVSPYAYPLNNASDNSLDEPLLRRKSSKKRVASSAKKISRGQKYNRTAPPQKITSAERERIVNLTTKLLVATETIALPNNKMQSREIQTHHETFPVIPALRRVQQMRPKSAYSDPGPSVFSLSKKPLSASRIHSAGKLSSSIKSSQSLSNKEDSDFYIRKHENNYIVKKKASSYPSSVLSYNSTQSSIRPKSAIRSNYICHQTQLDSSDEDIYDHSSTEVTPRHDWVNEGGIDRSVSDISTQTIQNRGTQTKQNKLPEDESFEEKHLIAETSIFQPSPKRFAQQNYSVVDEDKKEEESVENMSTQTRRRDVEPKVLTYQVYVVTGNKLGSGTKASVKMNIFGEYGDTGDRPLIKSKLNQLPFQRNQMDVFYMDCMFLGKLSNIRIGHNGTSLGDSWYLERVIIKEGENATRAFNFVCNKWLSAKEGDGQIVRDLTLSQQIPISEIPTYKKNNAKPVPRKISSSEESYSSVSKSGERSSSAMSNSSIKSPAKVRTVPQKNNNIPPVKSDKKPSRPSFHKTTPPINDEITSSSSDSEAEKEIRQVEKLKRREKKLSRDGSLEKPKANVGGIINKVNQRTRTLSRKSSTDTQLSSGRSTPARKLSNQSARKKSEDLRASPVGNARKTPIALTKKSSFEVIKTASPSKNTLAAPIKVEADSSFKLSSSSSSSSSESSDTEQSKKSNEQNEVKKEKNSDEEVLVEFSNTNTVKKYSLDTTGEENNFMAGFLAGIKANKTKESEEEKEAKQKEIFEEQLRSGSTIHQACEDGDVARVKELISTVAELKDKVDERGWSPIHISAAFGHLDLVKWFSVTGVSLTKETPTGYTSIHLAAMNGHVNCIMILAAMGCPISSRTVDDSTPLHLAAMSGHIECVKWLLSNRAKLDVKDKNGRTPYDLAEEYQHEECIQLLKVMTKELKRKDSVMSLLRDPTALRKISLDQSDQGKSVHRNIDSGVGAESNEEAEEEEWISDTENAGNVVGRGNTSKSSNETPTKKPSVSIYGVVASRKLSRQDIRKKDELKEKKRNYEKQQERTRKSSFLDSIRQEIDDVDPDSF